MLTLEKINKEIDNRVLRIDAELGRRTFLDFIGYTFDGKYDAQWCHKLICKKIDSLLEQPGQNFLMIFMPPRHGKALEVNTPIPTPKGFTKIIDLQVGDKVFDEKGNVVNVIGKSPVWRNRRAYCVNTDDGDKIIADGEHEWLVRLCRKRNVFKLKSTKYLANRKCDRAAMIEAPKALNLPELDLPIAPYVLGVWLGDGSSKQATITKGKEDIGHIKAEIEKCGYKTSERKTEFTFGILGLWKELKANDLLNNKHIPPQYLRASRLQRLSLLQGLIDTDGYVAKDGQIEFCTTQKQIAYQVKELVSSLGYKASLIKGEAIFEGRNYGPKYRIMFYMANAARLPRKAKKCRHGIRAFRRYLTIEKYKNVDTVCIEVDSKSHLFLCGYSMLPTHNSEICLLYTSPSPRDATLSRMPSSA